MTPGDMKRLSFGHRKKIMKVNVLPVSHTPDMTEAHGGAGHIVISGAVAPAGHLAMVSLESGQRKGAL